MPIIRNLRKDFDEGRMDNLCSLTYEERGTQDPYVKKDINNPPSSSQLGLQANKRIDDVSRIAQMLVDNPGLKHLSNEAILKQGEITKNFKGKVTIRTKVGGERIVDMLSKEALPRIC